MHGRRILHCALAPKEFQTLGHTDVWANHLESLRADAQPHVQYARKTQHDEHDSKSWRPTFNGLVRSRSSRRRGGQTRPSASGQPSLRTLLLYTTQAAGPQHWRATYSRQRNRPAKSAVQRSFDACFAG